jgi:hypothetical protein
LWLPALLLLVLTGLLATLRGLLYTHHETHLKQLAETHAADLSHASSPGVECVNVTEAVAAAIAATKAKYEGTERYEQIQQLEQAQHQQEVAEAGQQDHHQEPGQVVSSPGSKAEHAWSQLGSQKSQPRGDAEEQDNQQQQQQGGMEGGSKLQLGRVKQKAEEQGNQEEGQQRPDEEQQQQGEGAGEQEDQDPGGDQDQDEGLVGDAEEGEEQKLQGEDDQVTQGQEGVTSDEAGTSHKATQKAPMTGSTSSNGPGNGSSDPDLKKTAQAAAAQLAPSTASAGGPGSGKQQEPGQRQQPVKLPTLIKEGLAHKADVSHNKAVLLQLKKHIQKLQLAQGGQGLGDWQAIVTPTKDEGAAKEIVITPEQPTQEAAAAAENGDGQQQGARRRQRASVPGFQHKPNMPGGPPYKWPKLIHQTVANRAKLSCQEMSLMDSWLKLNPGYRCVGGVGGWVGAYPKVFHAQRAGL